MRARIVLFPQFIAPTIPHMLGPVNLTNVRGARVDLQLSARQVVAPLNISGN